MPILFRMLDIFSPDTHKARLPAVYTLMACAAGRALNAVSAEPALRRGGVGRERELDARLKGPGPGVRRACGDRHGDRDRHGHRVTPAPAAGRRGVSPLGPSRRDQPGTDLEMTEAGGKATVYAPREANTGTVTADPSQPVRSTVTDTSHLHRPGRLGPGLCQPQ